MLTLVLMVIGVGIMLVAGVLGLIEGTIKSMKEDPEIKAARERELRRRADEALKEIAEEERKRAWREKVGKSNAGK